MYLRKRSSQREGRLHQCEGADAHHPSLPHLALRPLVGHTLLPERQDGENGVVDVAEA